MPILNYTTSIQAGKTVGEIQQMLARAGAQSVSIEYDADAMPTALTFTVLFLGKPMPFKVPCNAQGVLQALTKAKNVPRSSKTIAQARRVAWRIIKDWTEAQLAIVESQQAQMAEAFMPYALDTSTGQTMFERFTESTQKQLTAGA
jgi:hypothetical protein